MKAQPFNILFNINYKCDFGFSLYVTGNIPALGLWDPSKAIQMNWVEGHNWFTEISVAADEIKEISYKYFIASEKDLTPELVVWEKGSNRHIKLSAASSSAQLAQNDTWEHRDVKIMLKDPLLAEFKSRKEIYLCGDILNIMKIPAPIKMKLKEYPEPQNPAEKSRFWTASLCLHHSVTTFEYKYILFDKVKQSFIKNRKVTKSFARPESTAAFPVLKYQQDSALLAKLPLLKLSSSDEFTAELTPNEIYQSPEAKFDYVRYSDFIYDRISPRILLGASINEPEEVSLLKEEGVNVVFNLQTPDDIRRHNKNHDDVVRSCKNEEIEHLSFPINERNADEVVERCNKASKILKDMLDQSKIVYLHCTYGAVRSVHSLISYLCLFEKYEVNEAIQFVQSKRALAIPSVELAKGIIQS